MVKQAVSACLKIKNMSDRKTVTSQIDDGYAVQEGVLTEPEMGKLTKALSDSKTVKKLVWNGKIFAVRNLLDQQIDGSGIRFPFNEAPNRLR